MIWSGRGWSSGFHFLKGTLTSVGGKPWELRVWYSNSGMGLLSFGSEASAIWSIFGGSAMALVEGGFSFCFCRVVPFYRSFLRRMRFYVPGIGFAVLFVPRVARRWPRFSCECHSDRRVV